tara:strand:+ start:20511 stop:21104 length:594 start_codon:yes stop_codon:yes gene_type:complete
MRILFATSNQYKIQEARDIFGELGHTVEPLPLEGLIINFEEPKHLGLDSVAESKIDQALSLISGTEFEGSYILVEDSGVFTSFFKDWPGASSASVLSNLGLDGFLEKMSESNNREGEYRAVAIISDGQKKWKAIGICKGIFSKERLGEGGFGYDPVFIPSEGDGRTFAQMEPSLKSSFSHRAKALKSLSFLIDSPSK